MQPSHSLLAISTPALIDAKRIGACFPDLDSDKFEIRERAPRDLERFGPPAAVQRWNQLRGTAILSFQHVPLWNTN
jgi:hypothetical protein